MATGLCRLGRTAGWISRLSDDEFGRAVAFRLRGEGVDISRAKVDPNAPTGLMVRERREIGPIDVIYYRRGSAASRLAPADLDADYIASARYLHLTGITPALSASCRETASPPPRSRARAGVPVVLDPNLRFKLWSREEARTTLRDLATHADIILPGLDEAEFLTGESDPEAAARAFLAHAPSLRSSSMKLGADGALAVDARRAGPRPGHAAAARHRSGRRGRRLRGGILRRPTARHATDRGARPSPTAAVPGPPPPPAMPMSSRAGRRSPPQRPGRTCGGKQSSVGSSDPIAGTRQSCHRVATADCRLPTAG